LIISRNIRSYWQRCNTRPQKLFSFLLAKSITPSFRRQKNDRMAVKIKKQRVWRGGCTFTYFYPFCLLIISYLRCVHPPPKNHIIMGALQEGGARFVFSWFSICYTPKMGKSAPPSSNSLSKNTYKRRNAKKNQIFHCSFFIYFKSAFPSLLIRF
jgi:hypothetical protein